MGVVDGSLPEAITYKNYVLQYLRRSRGCPSSSVGRASRRKREVPGSIPGWDGFPFFRFENCSILCMQQPYSGLFSFKP